MPASSSGGEDKRVTLHLDRLIHEPARYTIMAHLYVVDSADFLFLVRQTGLTWGNLGAHVGKLENMLACPQKKCIPSSR